jgi:hypothetical protein
MATLLSGCQWLENTPFSVGIRESTWTYPVIESVRVLGLCVFRGPAVVVGSAPARHLAPACAGSGVGIMGRGIGFY